MIGVKELKEIAIKCGTPSYIFDTDVLCERIDKMQNKKEEKAQDDRRKERERQEEREDRKQEMQMNESKTIEATIQPQQVKPKKNIKYHKPTETYEFEYDETDDNDDDYYNR
jgi:hypothetical protein